LNTTAGQLPGRDVANNGDFNQKRWAALLENGQIDPEPEGLALPCVCFLTGESGVA